MLVITVQHVINRGFPKSTNMMESVGLGAAATVAEEDQCTRNTVVRNVVVVRRMPIAMDTMEVKDTIVITTIQTHVRPTHII